MNNFKKILHSSFKFIETNFNEYRIQIIGAAIIFCAIGIDYFSFEQPFNNYLQMNNGKIEENVGKSIDLIIQINTFLLTLSGGLFALLAVLHKSRTKNEFTTYFLILSGTMVCLSFFYGYKSLYELLNSISQNYSAIKPKESESIMYLSKQFYRFLFAVISAGIGYLFVSTKED